MTIESYSALVSIGLGLFTAALIISLVLYLLMPAFRTRVHCYTYWQTLGALGLISFASILGALVYQLVYLTPVCELCWWQRIFLFPTAIIALIAVWQRSWGAHMMVALLSLFGLLYATYHYYYHFQGLVLGNILSLPCSSGGLAPACTDSPILTFGFITIPLMGILVFVDLLILAFFAHQQMKRERVYQGNMKTSWVIGIIVASLLLIIGIALLRPNGPTAGGTAPALAADDHVKGATSSPVVLVEYLDFECAACGAYYPVVKSLEAEYGGRVTFVARHFPLPGHVNGMTAALAAEAAGRQGKFWEMHDLLFTRQTEWGNKSKETPEVFEAFAQELGLNLEQFRADVASAEVRARVDRDIAEGMAAGVRSTPTFFLNGGQLRGPQSAQTFKSLLDQALSTAAGGGASTGQ